MLNLAWWSLLSLDQVLMALVVGASLCLGKYVLEESMVHEYGERQGVKEKRGTFSGSKTCSCGFKVCGKKGADGSK